MFLQHVLLTVILMKIYSHRGEKSVPKEQREITWNASIISHFDSHTNQSELEVQRIIHLQNLANQLPDAFTDTKKVTKLHVPTANTLTRIDAPEGQLANESQKRLKRGRPFGSIQLLKRGEHKDIMLI